MCAPKTTDIAWYGSGQKAPLFEGLDAIDFPISTDSREVQAYFNQGLLLAYGFNHAEAARSFDYATRLDSSCAMGYWGFAYVLGPNYNAGMESDNYERAYKAIQQAVSLADQVSEKEQDLIQAMAKRYSPSPPEDRSALDKAYSDAMKELVKKYPTDTEVATLYAESLMDMHPWDLWDKQGHPNSWTPTILEALESVIHLDPRHPGGHHFYIHAVEASPTPELGSASAEVLDDDLVPGAGHLIHMPSHIYIRTGEYHKGTLANIKAIKADSNYVSLCHAQGAYPLAYYPHNYHFMAGTATLEGNSYWALKAATEVRNHADQEVMQEPGWGTLQHYYTIPYYVAVKFGKWDDILNMTNSNPELSYPEAVRHYARGMAYLGKQELNLARTELTALQELADLDEMKEVTVWDINSVHSLIQIAQLVLEGEVLATETSYDQATKKLRQAADLEDQLNYDEPPDWFFSVRHHLAAVQIEAGKYEDAILTLEEDLKRLPNNGWAHHGLLQAYRALGMTKQEMAIKDLIAESWATADVKISSSRIK
ncbi:MAG: hypothetical protein AAF587_17380 [Bacteroidota bacterium]